jgi:hypothetical protein
MHLNITVSAIAGVFLVATGLAFAQSHDPNMHGTQHGNAPKHDTHGSDTRELVTLPEPMAAHMMTNMRDHLLALQEIQSALASNDTELAAKIAEHRLGMTSLSLHGAHEVAKYMPKGMQDAGTGMHRAASAFAITAQNAGVTGELRSALAALSTVTAQCVGCHAGYRVK